jgi:hypothetical protein
MKIDIFVSRFSLAHYERVRNWTKFIVEAEMSIDDLYDLAQEICMKTKENDWSNFKEFINALEKK